MTDPRIPDDDRLTAHALGQLSAEDAAALETALAGDDAARAARDGLRQTADALAAALRTEASPGLGEERRAAILAAAPVASALRAAGGRRPRRARALRLVGLGVAWAATVLLAFGVGSWGLAERARTADAPMTRAFSPSSSPIGLEGYGADDGLEREVTEVTGGTGFFAGGGGGGHASPGGAPRGPAPVALGENGAPGYGSPDLGFVSHAGEPVRVGPGRGAMSTAFRGPGGAVPPGQPAFVEGGGVVADGSAGLSLERPSGTDDHDAIVESPFVLVRHEPLSTFSADVDTASYSIVRRYLQGGSLPPPGAVRIEEMVNYFRYGYAPPEGDAPFAVRVDAAECPWNLKHRLVRIGVKAKEIPPRARPSSNLVFLVDVSGSMDQPDKLPLVQKSLRLLVEELRPDDRVAIVVYAGASGLVLPSTAGSEKGAILGAIDRLSAGGSTNGAAGIELAYQQAQASFLKGGTNRVILATDGDWNVGVTDRSSLVRLIEQKAKTGVFLTVLGFGMGNLKDGTLEQLADKGDGNYGYVDSLAEGRRLLVEQAGGTLVTVAKDVKLQVEWNPARVAGYRLVGYENRRLAAQDFNDDKKDAGDVGAGHEVTAFYEVVPAGGEVASAEVDPLKYQPERGAASGTSAEMLTVKVRAKRPGEDASRRWETAFVDEGRSYAEAPADLKFAAAVATFGMLLRGSSHAGTATYDAVLELAGEGVGRDEEGFRRELLDLVAKAKALSAGGK